MIFIVMALIAILAYVIGGFSTARIITRNVRSLNIYRIGTGLADTENIYMNVSKPMGMLVGAIDAAKSYLFLSLVNVILNLLNNMTGAIKLDLLYDPSIMMVYAIFMLIGHCLPMVSHFRGGRGIFTYLGIAAYFSLIPTLFTGLIAWILVLAWKQIRFAQYMIVILPVLLTSLLTPFLPFLNQELPRYYTPLGTGMMLIMGILNFLVSKKLGEI
ncbi:MAG TPA: glycerol-3-phosphate acyltransferase [Candidatus Cloacimonadota bacterium]|nr:glycerol-3-phosphate acyltransferase [Candidatus Cloacimonadota bacterium]